MSVQQWDSLGAGTSMRGVKVKEEGEEGVNMIKVLHTHV
jgi:hypothetical protein